GCPSRALRAAGHSPSRGSRAPWPPAARPAPRGRFAADAFVAWCSWLVPRVILPVHAVAPRFLSANHPIECSVLADRRRAAQAAGRAWAAGRPRTVAATALSSAWQCCRSLALGDAVAEAVRDRAAAF